MEKSQQIRTAQSTSTRQGSWPTFDIERVLPQTDNFVRSYFTEGIKEDTPDEFHLWCGLAVLSVAAGRRVLLKDHTPVTGNLAICLTGATTVGKSRALAHAISMVRSEMRWEASNRESVRMLDNPGSGEFLVSSLVNQVLDPTDPKKPTGIHLPVKALIRFEEMSVFVNKGGGQGSILHQMIMGLANGDKYIGRGSLTNGSDAAEDAFATVLATTQTKSLQHMFGDKDRVSGLLNRFLFVQGIPKKKRARGGEPLDFSIAIKHLRQIRRWVAERDRVLDFDQDAGAAFDKLFEERIEPCMADDTSELVSRLDLTMKRLVLLFAINDRSEAIRTSHVNSASELLNYLVDCYAQVDRGLEVAEEDALKQALLDHVGRHSKANNGEPIKQGVLLDKVKSRKWPSSQKEGLLRVLERDGLVKSEPHQGKRGPSTWHWSLTEAGHHAWNGT